MRDDKAIHEIERIGNLFYLANAFIGAYNRRTDAIIREAEATQALARLTQRLKVQNDALASAINAPKE